MMIAKMRMQVGETVISWGAVPATSSADVRNVERPARANFAVIEGGRKTAAAPADALPLQAQSA